MVQTGENGNAVILYVDDEPQALKYFSMALASDYEIITAQSADDAERIIRDQGNRLGVVVTDQRMPVRSGTSLLESVRQTNPNVIRILTTAYSDLGNAIDAVNKGAVFRYVVKPWNVDDLRQDLRIALQVHRLQKDRDLLLAEKLSFKQSLRIADRTKALMVASGAIGKSHRAFRAVCGYVTDMSSLSEMEVAALPLKTNLDLWNEVATEAAYLKAIVAKLARSVTDPLYNRIDAAAVTASLESVASEPGFAWLRDMRAANSSGQPNSNPKSGYLDALIKTFVSGSRVWFEGQTPAVTVQTLQNGLQVDLTGRRQHGIANALLWDTSSVEAVPDRCQLLIAYILAHEVGGSITAFSENTSLTFCLTLPSQPIVGASDEDAQQLASVTFKSLERWG